MSEKTWRNKANTIRTQWLLGWVCLWVWCSPFQAEAKPRWLSASVNAAKDNIFVLINVKGRVFRRLHAKGRDLSGHVWVRNLNGWRRVKQHTMTQTRWTEAFSTSLVCRNALGRTKVVLQVSMSSGKWWWNRWRRLWQKGYISLHQKTEWIQCPALQDDLPPGSPPNTRQIPEAPPTVPTLPPEQQGHQPPPPTTPQPPAQPPPPKIVSRASFRSFYRSLKASRFPGGRLQVLKSWLSGLQGHLVRPRHVARILPVFRFSSGKEKAARHLSNHVLRPLRVSQVIRIVSPIRYSNLKLKIALMYCRGVANPAALHRLASQFRFSSSKQKILKRCR